MLEIVPIPAFEDNYIWLIRDDATAVAIDPGDARPVLDYLRQHGLALDAILLTHHHTDHCGGVAELLRHFDVPVYGPRREAIPGVSHPVGEGDIVAPPALNATFRVLDVPGHTAGHVAYYGINSLFCGDTLFACGCGRLFEGTPARMQESLAKIVALPDDTRVYCAHEYTLDNIRFARNVEPDNAALLLREQRDTQKRRQGLPTLPSTLAEEKASNPFLRWEQPQILEIARQFTGRPIQAPADIFAAIREKKDRADGIKKLRLD